MVESLRVVELCVLFFSSFIISRLYKFFILSLLFYKIISKKRHVSLPTEGFGGTCDRTGIPKPVATSSL